jgi:HlyD family secretion protein
VFAGSLIIVVMVIGCGGWAAMANLSGAIIAPGSVVVEQNVKKVQHLYGGIVAEIHVREGERVKAGQVVIRLDNTLTRAELGVIETQLVELSGRRVRLTAERDGAATIEFAADFETIGVGAREVMRGETRLFREARETRNSQKGQLRFRVEQLREEISGLQIQVRSKSKELALITKELEAVRGLQQRKLTPISRVYAMEREQTRLSGEHGNLLAQVARAKGQISEIELQIVSVDQNSKTEAQRELRAIEAKLSELKERQAAARDRLNRMEITAPQNGIVHELAVHTIGGVITPAAPIMSIVPELERRTVEIRISPIDIDQIAVGQSARLRFSAFNQRTTPEVAATVSQVAANTSQDQKSGASYYTGRLVLDKDAISKLEGLSLVPGMPVEAFISTGDRTAFSYFVKPLTDQFARAFKEE